MIHERHASPYVALLCQQRKRIWWKCPLFAIHHAHKWGIQPWKPQLTCCMLGSNAPTLHPRPSDVKSNFQKGHMQLISHYFLNEGDCWLVALIGTLISYYWRPYVPKVGIFLDKGWKTKSRKRKRRSDRRGKVVTRGSSGGGERGLRKMYCAKNKPGTDSAMQSISESVENAELN